MTHDDLTPWQDTPLVQALTGFGSMSELAGEDAAVATFRSSSPGRRRHVVRIVGTGATSVVLLGAVGGGVAAAAYTRSLPESMQSAFHDVFGPIGVPAPHKLFGAKGSNQASGKNGPQPVAPVPAASSLTPTPAPSVKPAPAPVDTPVPHGSAIAAPSTLPTPTATLSPESSATPTPTISPSPTAPATDPATWSMTANASNQIVRVHHSVGVTGKLLDASGQPVADQRVVVRVHTPGDSGWQRAAVRRTGSDGSVQAQLDDLTQNTVVVLGATHGVHSDPLEIMVQPTLSASFAPSADGTSYVVTVAADGGESGDVVDLLQHTRDGWQQVGEAQLDDSSSASFSVAAPTHKQRYLLRLTATQLHTDAVAGFVLQPMR